MDDDAAPVTRGGTESGGRRGGGVWAGGWKKDYFVSNTSAWVWYSTQGEVAGICRCCAGR